MKTKVHFSASRHLRRLLMRSVSLNPRNIEIWKAFVSYCEAFGSSKLLSRVLAKALRHNSDCVGLWLSCAAYESRKNVCFKPSRLYICVIIVPAKFGSGATTLPTSSSKLPRRSR